MSRPHPANTAARHAISESLKAAGVAPGTRLLVAVSGGSDSLALAMAVLFAGPRNGYPVASITVDHGLRAESAAEASRVRSFLEAHGADPAIVRRVEVNPSAGGPEAAARDQRYAAIAQVARELGAIVLTGHTADDQAETVLLGLARGSGARSIRGMAPATSLPGAPDILLLRPFLSIRRAELRAGLDDMGIRWEEDPTNGPESQWRAADGSLLRRVAIRHMAIPALERAIGGGAVDALARTAALLAADDDALETWAADAFEEMGGRLDIKALRGLPRAVRTRILRRAALRSGVRGGELMRWHIDHLDDLVMGPGGGRGINLPGVRAVQRGGKIMLERVGLTVSDGSAQSANQGKDSNES